MLPPLRRQRARETFAVVIEAAFVADAGRADVDMADMRPVERQPMAPVLERAVGAGVILRLEIGGLTVRVQRQRPGWNARARPLRRQYCHRPAGGRHLRQRGANRPRQATLVLAGARPVAVGIANAETAAR